MNPTILFFSLFTFTQFINVNLEETQTIYVDSDVSHKLRLGDGDESAIIEAFKSIDNDRIIDAKMSDKYNQLKWFSVGVPKLLERQNRIFHVTSDGFYVFIETLKDEHSRLLAKEASFKYKIEINSSQIVDVPLSMFNCLINLPDVNRETLVIGRVKQIKETPFRMDFKAPGNTRERKLILDKINKNEDITLDCEMASKGKQVTSKLELTTSLLGQYGIIADIFGPFSQSVFITRTQLNTLAESLYEKMASMLKEYQISEFDFINHFIHDLVSQTSDGGSFKAQSLDRVILSMSNYSIDEHFLKNTFESNMNKYLEISNGQVVEDSMWINKSSKHNFVSTNRNGELMFMNIISLERTRNAVNAFKTRKGDKNLDALLNELNIATKGEIEWMMRNQDIVVKNIHVANLTRLSFSKTILFNKIQRKHFNDSPFARVFSLYTAKAEISDTDRESLLEEMNQLKEQVNENKAQMEKQQSQFGEKYNKLNEDFTETFKELEKQKTLIEKMEKQQSSLLSQFDAKYRKMKEEMIKSLNETANEKHISDLISESAIQSNSKIKRMENELKSSIDKMEKQQNQSDAKYSKLKDEINEIAKKQQHSNDLISKSVITHKELQEEINKSLNVAVNKIEHKVKTVGEDLKKKWEIQHNELVSESNSKIDRIDNELDRLKTLIEKMDLISKSSINHKEIKEEIRSLNERVIKIKEEYGQCHCSHKDGTISGSLLYYFQRANLQSKNVWNNKTFNGLVSTEMAIVNNNPVYFLVDHGDHALVKMSSTWQYITKINTITLPRAIKWANDHLYVSAQDGFYKMDYNFNIKQIIPDSGAAYTGIYYNASDSTLAVTVFYSNRLYWIGAASLTVLGNINIGNPMGVSGYSDSLYVSASFNTSTVICVIRNRVITNRLLISTTYISIWAIVLDDYGYMAVTFRDQKAVKLYHINGTSTGFNLTFPDYVYHINFDYNRRMMISTVPSLYFYI